MEIVPEGHTSFGIETKRGQSRPRTRTPVASDYGHQRAVAETLRILATRHTSEEYARPPAVRLTFPGLHMLLRDPLLEIRAPKPIIAAYAKGRELALSDQPGDLAGMAALGNGRHRGAS
jgi:hypothetical protein